MALLTVQGNGLQVHLTASSSVVSPVNAQIWQVASQRNPHMGPFSNIPADILYAIARHASPLHNLVLVCKRWRDILLFAPSLWANIYIEFPEPRSTLPGALTPERLARATLRRSGRTASLSVHLKKHNLNYDWDSVAAVVDMIRARGYRFIRRLTLDGSWGHWWQRPGSGKELSFFSHLVGEWKSLLYLDLALCDTIGWTAEFSRFVDCITATAPALRHLSVSTEILLEFGRKLSSMQSLVNLDIRHWHRYERSYILPVWRSVKSLKSHTTIPYYSPIGNPFDLQRINTQTAEKGDIFIFPSLTHAEFINHTLDVRSTHILEFLTDLVLICVDITGMAPRSVEMPSLRRLVADHTRGIDCIIAPVLETLSIGPLRESVGVNVGDYLSKLFSGHPQQLDPVHLDLRPIYTWDDMGISDTTVPLLSLSYLRRVERISITRLATVPESDQWVYRVLQSLDIEDGRTIKGMLVLPKWKEMNLGEDDAPDWLCGIIFHRHIAGFPVKLCLEAPRLRCS
jgi:hypothetical protein